MAKTAATTKAYSYVRFSSIAQERGDSLRRQTKGTDDYVQRKGYVLDTTLHLQDLGVSAFRGANVREGALGGFLEAIRQGRVEPGSVLIVESLDRLTRDQLSEALVLFMEILRADVRIATISPEREYTRESLNEIGTVIEPLVIFMRAHEESKTKSERLQKAWQAKREKLATTVLTSLCPKWCRVKVDRTGFELIPEKAETVRQIFEWAASGLGVNAITKKLNQSIQTIARTDTWHRSYVLKILKNRAAIGEYQPHLGHSGPNRKPIGEPIPNYYPKVIDEPLFYAAQDALRSRRTLAGPTGKTVANLFTGKLQDARDKSTLNMIDKGDGRQLVSSTALRGVPGSRYLAFSYELFERAFLSFVRDVTPADVLPPKSNRKVDVVAQLAGRIAELDHKIDRTKAKIASDPDVDVLLDVLTNLERQKKPLVAEYETAKGAAAVSEAEALGEAKSILELMGDASGDDLELLRSRLRQKLRSLVSSIFVCVWEEKVKWHPIARDKATTFRFVEVQVTFSNTETQFFFLENKTGIFFGPPFKGEKLTEIPEEDRPRAKQWDLSDYTGWYDTPFRFGPDWPSMWRLFCVETAKHAMRNKSEDKRLDGIRAPTFPERNAMDSIKKGKGDQVHWRTVGSLTRRGWAEQSDGELRLTDIGTAALNKYGQKK